MLLLMAIPSAVIVWGAAPRPLVPSVVAWPMMTSPAVKSAADQQRRIECSARGGKGEGGGRGGSEGHGAAGAGDNRGGCAAGVDEAGADQGDVAAAAGDAAGAADGQHSGAGRREAGGIGLQLNRAAGR